jgi:oligopeptidase A
VVNKNSIFKRGEEYKMYCAFLHIFWGEYECKYYSYMWAEQLWADVFSRIKERGMFNSEIWKEYRDKILAQWTRKPAKELFRDFMGRDVSEEALLRKYWLI